MTVEHCPARSPADRTFCRDITIEWAINVLGQKIGDSRFDTRLGRNVVQLISWLIYYTLGIIYPKNQQHNDLKLSSSTLSTGRGGIAGCQGGGGGLAVSQGIADGDDGIIKLCWNDDPRELAQFKVIIGQGQQSIMKTRWVPGNLDTNDTALQVENKYVGEMFSQERFSEDRRQSCLSGVFDKVTKPT